MKIVIYLLDGVTFLCCCCGEFSDVINFQGFAFDEGDFKAQEYFGIIICHPPFAFRNVNQTKEIV